jgi:hypothetical protein
VVSRSGDDVGQEPIGLVAAPSTLAGAIPLERLTSEISCDRDKVHMGMIATAVCARVRWDLGSHGHDCRS